LALNSRIWAIYLGICFVCNQAKYYESKTMIHGPKILGGAAKRGLKLRQDQTKA